MDQEVREWDVTCLMTSLSRQGENFLEAVIGVGSTIQTRDSRREEGPNLGKPSLSFSSGLVMIMRTPN